MLFRVFTVLAVIALAVSTWIVSSPGRRPRPTSNTAGAAMPGYFLKNAVLTDFDATGKPTIRIEAERIDQLAQSPEVALYNVRVKYLAPSGQAWLLFGDVAHVQPGGRVIDVEGNVRLHGDGTGKSAGALIRTDTLTYDVVETLATTKSDVRIEFGRHTLSAHGLTANLKERTMRLESKVNGRFQP